MNKQDADSSLWDRCGPCAYARAGGPPCYFHKSSKFGVGTAITNNPIIKALREELGEAIKEELDEWP